MARKFYFMNKVGEATYLPVVVNSATVLLVLALSDKLHLDVITCLNKVNLYPLAIKLIDNRKPLLEVGRVEDTATTAAAIFPWLQIGSEYNGPLKQDRS